LISLKQGIITSGFMKYKQRYVYVDLAKKAEGFWRQRLISLKQGIITSGGFWRQRLISLKQGIITSGKYMNYN